MKTFFLCLFMLTMCKLFNAQSDSIDTRLNDSLIVLDLTISIDNVSYYDTSYVLNIVNLDNGGVTLMRVSNQFYIYLDYNNKFEVSISHPTTDCKAIFVDTHAPKNQWHIISGFKLTKSNNKEKIFVGSIVFDEKTETFLKKKIE